MDLRWFGRSTPNKNNRVYFEEKYKDIFGMPQPTFEFQLNNQDSEDAGLMMEEMCTAATTLGGFLPGSEPSFLKPGTALHITVSDEITNFAIYVVVHKIFQIYIRKWLTAYIKKGIISVYYDKFRIYVYSNFCFVCYISVDQPLQIRSIF